MMISYEDEIDTSSHRKQTRRRRAQERPPARGRAPEEEAPMGRHRVGCCRRRAVAPATPIENVNSRNEASPGKSSGATFREASQKRRSTRHLRQFAPLLPLLLAVLPSLLLLSLPMVTRTEATLADQQQQANAWRTPLASAQPSGPLEGEFLMSSHGVRRAPGALDDAPHRSFAWPAFVASLPAPVVAFAAAAHDESATMIPGRPHRVPSRQFPTRRRSGRRAIFRVAAKKCVD